MLEVPVQEHSLIGGLVVRSGIDDEPVAVVEDQPGRSLYSRWKKLERIGCAEDLLTWLKTNYEWKS